MFHDASVSRFLVGDTELVIEVEAFAFSPTETMPPARIVIAGARGVFRNDERVQTFAVESDDAEIHALDVDPEGVRLVLFWHRREPEATALCCAYRFPGATFHVAALSGGHLAPVHPSRHRNDDGT